MPSIRAGVQGQPVEEGGSSAFRLHAGDIPAIGFEDRFRAGADGGGHGGQRLVLRRRRGERHAPGGGAGAPADISIMASTVSVAVSRRREVVMMISYSPRSAMSSRWTMAARPA
jgi:hypothetical protein